MSGLRIKGKLKCVWGLPYKRNVIPDGTEAEIELSEVDPKDLKEAKSSDYLLIRIQKGNLHLVGDPYEPAEVVAILDPKEEVKLTKEDLKEILNKSGNEDIARTIKEEVKEEKSCESQKYWKTINECIAELQKLDCFKPKETKEELGVWQALLKTENNIANCLTIIEKLKDEVAELKRIIKCR